MRVFHLYTGDDGHSHVAERMLRVVERPNGRHTLALPAREPVFAAVGDERGDWHNAPRRQIVVILEGRQRFTTVTGEELVVGPGQVVLADDLTGSGHLTRQLDGHAKVVVIPVDLDCPLDELFGPAEGDQTGEGP